MQVRGAGEVLEARVSAAGNVGRRSVPAARVPAAPLEKVACSLFQENSDKPRSYLDGFLVPGSCECCLIWQKGLCRCDEVKDFEMGKLLTDKPGCVCMHQSPRRHE